MVEQYKKSFKNFIQKKILQMNRDKNYKNNKIIEEKIDEAQFELSKFGSSLNEDSEYLLLRSKIFY